MTNQHKLLDRITLGTIIIFSLVILLLAFLFVRHLRLQQTVDETSIEILDNVEELQVSAGELQETVEHLRSSDDPPPDVVLGQIDRQLDEINQHLEQIEDNIDEVAPLLVEADAAAVEDPLQDEINLTFLVMAWLVGITSLGTALIVYIVLKPGRLRSKRRLNITDHSSRYDHVTDR